MASIATELLRRHRLTVEQYHRMGETGILRADARVELIQGEIIDMTPIGSRHAGTINQLAHVLGKAFGDRVIVLVQNPVTLDRRSEPQPDLALLRPRADFYKSAHPTPSDVLLIIEVADTSLHYDQTIKVPLYGRHGIPEAWIIDTTGHRLLRHIDPDEDGYQRSDAVTVFADITIVTLPGVRLDLSTIFND